jgi:hypothetical protein
MHLANLWTALEVQSPTAPCVDHCICGAIYVDQSSLLHMRRSIYARKRSPYSPAQNVFASTPPFAAQLAELIPRSSLPCGTRCECVGVICCQVQPPCERPTRSKPSTAADADFSELQSIDQRWSSAIRSRKITSVTIRTLSSTHCHLVHHKLVSTPRRLTVQHHNIAPHVKEAVDLPSSHDINTRQRQEQPSHSNEDPVRLSACLAD